MRPSTVESELDLTVESFGNICKLDFINAVCNFVHHVCRVCGVPRCAVEPCAFTVTNNKYVIEGDFSDLFNIVAGYGYYITAVAVGCCRYGEVSGSGDVEGDVVAVLVAVP